MNQTADLRPVNVCNAACTPSSGRKKACNSAGLRPVIKIFLQSYRARLPGKTAGLNCLAGLPGQTAGPDCRSRLPGKTAGQDCRARLPGKTDEQDCRARLPVKTAGQDSRARLTSKTAGQGYRARLPGNTARARLHVMVLDCVLLENFSRNSK
jgi:hypothetical protein